MAMQIGPAFRDYAPAPVYVAATAAHKGSASVGPDGDLVGYQSGSPFPDVDCEGDPQAGVKLIWNFIHRWEGFGTVGSFRYGYFDAKGERPVSFQGRNTGVLLKHRPEPQFEKNGGDVFRNEKRAAAVRLEFTEPGEAAGMRILTYRYEASFGPLATATPEDSWVFVPDLRRVRKISQTQRTTAVSGTDFTFDDLFTFSGLPAQYRWRCLGEQDVLAPVNTLKKAYPYVPDADFGPNGLSNASDRWELRRAVRLELVPKDAAHIYSKKIIWLDRQTYEPLYSFAYDKPGALWKIIHHNHRFSEDPLDDIAPRDWYPAWENVPEPRDLRLVSDVMVNIQTGTGNRIEYWDAHGGPLPRRELRRAIDATSLSR